MNILHISPYVPSLHTNHAGGVCMGKQVEALRKKHNVFVLSFITMPLEEKLVKEEYDTNNSYFIRISNKDRIIQGLLHLNKPLMFSARSSKEFKHKFLEIIEEKQIDAIHCEYTAMAQYIWIKEKYPNIMFNIVEHDVTRQSFYRKANDSTGLKKLFWKWQLNLATKWEKEYCTKANHVIAVNSKDERLLHEYYGLNNVELMNPYYGVDFDEISNKQVDKIKKSICFIGQMGREENHLAAMRLIQIVQSLNRDDIKLTIIGAHPNEELLKQECDNIHITGFVDSIEDEILKNEIAVFPLTLGAGIKLKVLLACGLGLPVITTDIGAEGIDEDGSTLILAQTNEQIKNEILNLIDNPEKIKLKSNESKEFVQKYFSWNKTVELFDRLYEVRK